jgi:hypothetical protein
VQSEILEQTVLYHGTLKLASELTSQKMVVVTHVLKFKISVCLVETVPIGHA